MQLFRITGCAVVYDHERKILLKKDPVRGWELPGGHVAYREDIPSAVIREVKEETGIDIEITKFCGLTQDVKDHVCHMFWLARAVGGAFATGEESLDVGFFTIDEALSIIQRADFREELQKCLDDQEHPFYISFY
jgi:ADP-ribose pyrophosphatase YjhB (NUDIX family)